MDATTGFTMFIIMLLLSAVVLFVVLFREEREERERIEWWNHLIKMKRALIIKLTELNQQKQEIEKQVFKEDEYNLYVDEQIIEKMCLVRLRKEYTDHSYILYEKLLKEIESLSNCIS